MTFSPAILSLLGAGLVIGIGLVGYAVIVNYLLPGMFSKEKISDVAASDTRKTLEALNFYPDVISDILECRKSGRLYATSENDIPTHEG